MFRMLSSRRRFLVAILISISVFLSFHVWSYQYQIRNTLSYFSRPLWDVPDGPTQILTHYYSEGFSISNDACELHGWAPRAQEPEIWDAVIFSSELDLLEIRMNELDAAVDKFFILESDKSFTGLPKPLSFALNRTRFARFEHKIVYSELPGREPSGGKTAWDIEASHRFGMTQLLRDAFSEHHSPVPPLVVYADVDEIPRQETLKLLKKCQAPDPIHLQMRNYIYSFEWPVGAHSWRASVHVWKQGSSFYGHSKWTEVALADAGWHCSFCFRRLEDFVQKMTGFSHHDRIGGDQSLLDLDRIQKTICEGKDIFNMLPEAYSYKDLLAWTHPTATRSAVGIPLHVLQSPDKFKFLLPGGCYRDQ